MTAMTALQEVLDPEVGIDIVSLGLVEEVSVESGAVRVGLIMTSVACPMHFELVRMSEIALRGQFGADAEVEVQILDSPEWTPDRMSPEARRQLGW